jgi:hypothetical protein
MWLDFLTRAAVNLVAGCVTLLAFGYAAEIIDLLRRLEYR